MSKIIETHRYFFPKERTVATGFEFEISDWQRVLDTLNSRMDHFRWLIGEVSDSIVQYTYCADGETGCSDARVNVRKKWRGDEPVVVVELFVSHNLWPENRHAVEEASSLLQQLFT